MGNIDINTIRKKGFEEGSELALVEEYCRQEASEHTDEFIKLYQALTESRNGHYINSDLMKMVFPFYAKSNEHRKIFNVAITNTAAVLTNETYMRAIQSPEVEHCIFVVGPYGAGKSFFCQSLFENDESKQLLQNSIIYEGSITPPAFEEKIAYAIQHGVIPSIIALNPTLELSIRNIRERAQRIGRDVEKKEVVDKFSCFYTYLRDVVQHFPEIAYIIYNKTSNATLDLKNSGSQNLEDLNHGTYEEILDEYDKIMRVLNQSGDGR